VKRKAKFEINVTEKNAHVILDHLAKSLDVDHFVLCFCEDDSPEIRAGIQDIDDATAFVSEIDLGHVRKENGRLVAGERDIALWQLSRLYSSSPVAFKKRCTMTLKAFARSLGFLDKLPEIEKVFCEEILEEMPKYLHVDPMWRVWNGSAWVEIDPWKFAVEMDLNGAA
jgi:hypothetical protein